MLLLFNLICPCLLIFINRKLGKTTEETPKCVEDHLCGWFFTICVVWLIAFIFAAALILSISKLLVIDDKISLYEEENLKIETQMNELTSAYMDYESDIFKNIAAESSINVALIIPELKSNELVMSQLTTYKENNEQIKKLKERKIEGKINKWWLYFGK